MKNFILALLVATSFSAQAASYFVVVPVPNKKVSNAAISVTLAGVTLPSGLIGTPYAGFNFKPLLSVTGDPNYTGYGVKWSLVSGRMPAGLVLNADGTVSGTPTASGSESFQVQASYKTKTGAQAYQIVVANITVSLAQATPPQGIVGQAYRYDLNPLVIVDGDQSYVSSAVTWRIDSGALPPGLALGPTGVISGTPTAAASTSVTIRAAYRGVSGAASYVVTTLKIAVTFNSATLAQATTGQAYSYDVNGLLSVTGDPTYPTTPASWSIVSGTLPSGLSLSAAGVLAGTPTGVGSTSFSLQANYRAILAQKSYTLVVAQLVHGSAAENSGFTLTAPAGTVFREVVFASYGTPSGSGPAYTKGSCHSTDTLSVINAVFLNKNSGSLSVDNNTFGDPCSGIGKTLAVTLKAY